MEKRRIGVRELAKLAGVSLGTVDRALNGRKEISERTRQRILRIAERHGYEPNPSARALSFGRPCLRIGASIPREIHYFYDQVRDGIRDEAGRCRHLGVEIHYRSAEGLGAGEARAVRELLDRGINALIVTPGDPVKVAPLIDRAEKERNIRVICVATDDSLSSRSTAVSVNPALNGRMAAELMANVVPPGSQVAVVTGMLGTEDHGRKLDAFSEAFPRDCPGGRVVAVIEGHESERETLQKCTALLGKHDALAGLYVNTVNCLPVCRALKTSGRAGKIRLIATDLFREAVPYFMDGTITASIYQRPYLQGQTAVRLLIDHLVYGKDLPPNCYLSPEIVMRSNLGLFREVAEA